MAVGITVHLQGDHTAEFPEASAVERIVDLQNHRQLGVGCMAVFKGRELQKVFKRAEWCWYERQVDGDPEPTKRVMIPRRNGTVTAITGNRWQLVEGTGDQRGPYHSWVIYRDKDIRAVFRSGEVEIQGEPWLETALV